MRELLKEIETRGIETVRFSFADQHGVLRSKSIAAAEVPVALKNGVGFPSSLLAKDTSNRTVFPVFTAGAGFGIPEMEGAADALMIADPGTWRVLPWTPKTGWLCRSGILSTAPRSGSASGSMYTPRSPRL